MFSAVAIQVLEGKVKKCVEMENWAIRGSILHDFKRESKNLRDEREVLVDPCMILRAKGCRGQARSKQGEGFERQLGALEERFMVRKKGRGGEEGQGRWLRINGD